jgi:L-ectoine synthase
MKVVRHFDVTRRGTDVACPKGGFVSYRYVLKDDGMGFGLHKTMIPRGDVQHWHYTKHLEACFCVSGYGELTNLATGDVHGIGPDDCYLLDSHDDHAFQALTDVILISVFNPPVTGAEVHKEDGSYE